MTTLFNQIYWREPLWILLCLFPLILMAWKKWHQSVDLKHYADTHLLPWVEIKKSDKLSHWHAVKYFIIWLLFALSAAGPRSLISMPDELLPPEGAAIIVVDHSRSMKAKDLFPNRLSVVNRVIKKWSLEKNHLKLGLVIFSGTSHMVLPATSDNQIFYDVSKTVMNIQLPTYGSAIVEALNQAKTLLNDIPGKRDIIVLSDGDFEGVVFDRLTVVINDLSNNNISLSLLGVGTLSPTPLADRPGHWLSYNGKPVLTRLNEADLQQLAKNKQVSYFRLIPEKHSQLSSVIEINNFKISKDKQALAVWNEWFSWPLMAAILLLSLSRLHVLYTYIRPFVYLSLIFSTLSILSYPQDSYADNNNARDVGLMRAYTFWVNSDFKRAEEMYASIPGYQARIGEGASCFREEQINCAIDAFSRAAWLAENDQQHGVAAYNLANSLFKQGDFQSAIILYKDALRYQPKNKQYKNNLDFTLVVEENIRNYKQRLANRNKTQQSSKGTGETIINFDNEWVSTMDTSFYKMGTVSKNSDKQIMQSLSDDQLVEYMQRNQVFAQLNPENTTLTQQENDWSHFSNEDPFSENTLKFWLRLFELEENIPAHREQPEMINGVRPW